MHLRSDSFRPYDWLDSRLAFGRIPAEGRFALGGDRNPHLAWSGVPEGTRSFALICHDPEVPSRGDDVNQEGRSVRLPRTDTGAAGRGTAAETHGAGKAGRR